MMKKAVLLLLLFFLTGCEENPIIDCKDNKNVGGICMDETPPTIHGASDILIELNDDFDPLEGITALDDLDGDITDRLIVTSFVDVNSPGTYLVKYEVEDDFLNKTTKVRFVTVTFVIETGSNLVYNGTFEDGLYGYTIFTYEQANADISVVNEELVVEILSVDTDVWYAPRVSYGGIPLEQGSYYKVSLDVTSSTERHINVLVGELLDSEPWYVDFATDIQKVYVVDSTKTTIEFTFMHHAQTNDNASILIEMGDIGENTNLLSTITIDNISLTKIEESDYILDNTSLITDRIEAENYTEMSGIQTEATGDTGGGENVGWIDPGDTMMYYLRVEEDGDYLIMFRVASPSGDRHLGFYQDDVLLTEINIPSTSGWQDYTTVLGGIVSLEAGIYEFEIRTNTGGFNINYIDIEKVN